MRSRKANKVVERNVADAPSLTTDVGQEEDNDESVRRAM
jgi:hypothetical protein